MKELDIFHGLSHELPLGLPKKINKLVTVHDLIFYRYPKLYNSIDVCIYKAKVKSACKIADKIIAISNQTADDLEFYVNVDRKKIEVVHQGCHPIFKQNVLPELVTKVKQVYRLPENYILNVGTIEKRKNALLLIKALAHLPVSDRLPVVIVGKSTKYVNEIKAWATKLNVINLITFLHAIPFTDFPAIYKGANVFVYPSLFEGFGIPLIEAIECGIPVITSRGSCFSEIAGPDSIYIDPASAEELSFQLGRILRDNSLQQKMTNASRKHIERFQPSVISARLQSIYESL